MWVPNTKRHRIPNAAPKHGAVFTLCMGWNEAMFFPKLKSLTCRSFMEKKISCEGDIWILSWLVLHYCFLFFHYFLYSLLQMSKFKFETFVLSPYDKQFRKDGSL
jgi:hypothetical protein